MACRSLSDEVSLHRLVRLFFFPSMQDINCFFPPRLYLENFNVYHKASSDMPHYVMSLFLPPGQRSRAVILLIT